MFFSGPCDHNVLEQKSVGIYQRCRNHRRAEGNLAFHVHDRNRARILLKRSLPRFNDSIILRAERVSARGSQESVPYRRDMLVVVEGMRDMRAVRRAVDVDVSASMTPLLLNKIRQKVCFLCVQVYVLGSATRASDETVLKELERLGRRYRKIVLLLDADVAGRQARNVLDRVLQGCWHAFIPNEESTLMEQKDYKGVGDVGVEHASKQAIREGLSKIRRSNPDRKLFTREKLTSLKLIAPLHERVR